MGYGEMGGGGSVHWNVVHADGTAVSQRDPDPGQGGTFIVVIDGVPRPPVPIDPNNPAQIQIFWGRHNPDNFNQELRPIVEELRRRKRQGPPPGEGTGA